MTTTRAKITTSKWEPAEASVEVARVLDHRVHPEGLDVDRVRFNGTAEREVGGAGGKILSVVAGSGALHVDGEARALEVDRGTHVFLPAGRGAKLVAHAGTSLVTVTAPSKEQSPGEQLLIRHERFVSASAAAGHALRWILTPQYLSRRIFLHHDRALASKSKQPVSWFRTTMFDVSGLPKNADGESVFKMSYNSRTEINVLYDVTGDCRVRMAKHPYGSEQAWEPWTKLTTGMSYHLDEEAEGPDAEWIEAGGERRCFRNKHEVFMDGGHCSLFCLFDPAPTGVERHQAGEYSDYEGLGRVIARPEYEVHRREIGAFDEMVDTLSLAKARGELEAQRHGALWKRYEEGRAAQRAIEEALYASLEREGAGREKVIAPYTLTRGVAEFE